MRETENEGAFHWDKSSVLQKLVLLKNHYEWDANWPEYHHIQDMVSENDQELSLVENRLSIASTVNDSHLELSVTLLKVFLNEASKHVLSL